MEYHAIEEADSFERLKNILVDRAKNGVEVRIVYDDIGSVGFTGGYNLADEYFNITHPYGRWLDTGIRLEGEAVRSLTVMFLEMWNVIQKTEVDMDQYLVEYQYTAKEDGFIVPYADLSCDHR